MRLARNSGLLILALVLLALATSARYANQITGVDTATFEGRDVLVIRTSSAVPTPNGFSRDPGQSTVTFRLSGVGADNLQSSDLNMQLLREVRFIPVEGSGTDVAVRLASPALVDDWSFRLNQPSDHVLLFEVFPGKEEQRSARLISDIEGQLGIDTALTTAPAEPAAPEVAGFNPDELGIPTIDLSGSDPQRVLGLAVKTGLLDLRKPASVSTENMGTLDVKPAGLSLASWTTETPPGELYLSGKPELIANFMSSAEPANVARFPALTELWSQSKPNFKTSSGPSPATRSRMRDDPYGGYYYEETRPNSGSFLSDIRVTLPAMNGLDLYDVINYLSLISGISIIIDPYTFDEPTGNRRDPLPPDSDNAENSGPGFRPAGVFDPTFARSGTVQGNLVNVPFDTALKLILDTHGLEFVIYNEGGSSEARSAQIGTRSAREGGGGSDPYARPVVLITSRERLEQEISGTSEVNLQQFHYADPYLISDMLDNLNMRPSTTQGWYIYDGPGSGGGGIGGGGNGGGGAGGGGGGLYSAGGGLLVYRGRTRQPVYDAVTQAVANGDSVVRVLLAPEPGDQYVTAFAGQL